MASSDQLSPRAMFNAAFNRIGSGDLAGAASICQDAINRDPNDVSMTALLGAVHLKRREARKAEKYLRKAIDLAPTFAKPHEDLGFLLLQSGREEESIKLLEHATRLDPKAGGAYFTLGRAYAKNGRARESDTAFEASFAIDPRRGKLALAAEHHKSGRYKEAEAVLRRLIELAPDFALAHLDLGRLLQDQHRLAESIDLLAKSTQLQPNSAKAHYLYGSVLAEAGKTHEAVESYQAALHQQPSHPGALLGLGHALKTVGKQEEAVAAYRNCIRHKPDNGEAYWSLANLKTYKLSGQDIAEMESVLAKTEGPSDQSKVNFLFALGKASEDAGEFDNAWDYFRRGNELQRQSKHYDPVQTELGNDQLIRVFNRDFLARSSGDGNQDASPIFVVGLPRSGSTLIEQILASHSRVEATSELPYLGRMATSVNRIRADGINYPHAVRELAGPHLQALGQQYLDLTQFHRQLKKPRFIDKNPNNFPSIGLLHLILPNSRIIDARRYPLDSTLSCYRQLFAKGQTFLYDLTEVGEYYLQYQRMMDHWHRVLPGRVHTVQYEKLVTNFEEQVRSLLDYCGLPFEENCLNFHLTDRPVRTASSEQVRQPAHTRSVHFWRNYAAHLDEIIEVLEPILPRYEAYEFINKTTESRVGSPG